MRAYTTWGEWRVDGETSSEIIATVIAPNKQSAQAKAVEFARRTLPFNYFNKYFRFITLRCGDPNHAIQ